jgi:hypothetical protein
MPKLTFSAKELNAYFRPSGKRHKAYNETVQMAYELKIHADGVYPVDMVEERRPSESLAVKDYRKKIWKPITKPIFHKVITELNKIRRSAEWSIKYDPAKVPVSLPEDETLQHYCETAYPQFTSITNWVFKALLPGYCKDANAIVAVIPWRLDFKSNEYVQPFGYLFGSELVIDYVQNDYAVIKSTDKVVYKNEDGNEWYGDVYWILTTQYVERWEQSNGTQNFALAWHYDHGIGQLPAFRVEGMYKKALDNTFLFESRLAPMLPRLDEALREYGDMQAEVVQHIYSEKWEFITDDCPTCKGKGKIKQAGFSNREIDCTVCEGSGGRARGPYSVHQVRAPMAGDNTPLITPPIGYIQKNTEIVKIQDERVDKHIVQALAAINMEYLAESPLNQSGTAKEVDKDALNNFVHAIAEDVVAAMDRLYSFVSEYRYGIAVPKTEDRAAMLPYISVPERFDLLSSNYLEAQIAKQKENKGNPLLIVAMEEDYVSRKFGGDSVMRDKLTLALRLDPLAGISEEDKTLRLGSRGITEEAYVISCNIRDFIERAIEEKGDTFFSTARKDQKALMLEYAKEQTSAASTGSQIILDEKSSGA